MSVVFVYGYGDHRDLHALTHSFPPRRSSDLGHGYQVHVGPMYSDARGTITLKTTDPHDHPALRFNYLSTDQDRREWIESIRVARTILNQRSEEHTSELQSLMRNSYAVFCLKKKTNTQSYE